MPPQGADQFLNAEAVAESGAGLSIAPEAVSADAIRDAVAIMLRDEAYRRAALRVAESIGAMPPPDDVARVLEQLA